MKDLVKPESYSNSTKSVKSPKSPKSPLIFLLLIGALVISTLVVASEYFLRPQIEAQLKKRSSTPLFNYQHF
nr:hypothetical protein [uncultured Gammaproteobacteria bacterium]